MIKESSNKIKINKLEGLYYQLNTIDKAMAKDKNISMQFKKGFNVVLNYVY
ncbi:hypothetical protein [Clostridium tetani]|uniref:hypothetical protein n=1 Tax=Clostridium tetani TaxID=1513 RepID=UPI0003C0CE1E|nr:hypothetical protein [Clostridium tetani]CDI50304.1 hypothetical protein BN906_02320 [Clostridium tetani 12124569]